MAARPEHQSGVTTRNRFEVLAVEAQPNAKTRMSAIEFNVAEVRKPLASAVKMVKANNRVVLDEEQSYIENKATGEKMMVKIQDETFVFDVEYDNGEKGTITLDSGAGVNVWPRGARQDVPVMAKKPGLRMCAANGTEIKNYGRKVIQFKGLAVKENDVEESGFRRLA